MNSNHKNIVSKNYIDQYRKCHEKGMRYGKALELLSEYIEMIVPLASYNKYPDEFKQRQRKSLRVIWADLKSMRLELNDMVLNAYNTARDLQSQRDEQLGKGKGE